MKNLFVSSLAVLLGLSIPSFARLGETFEETIARYGNVVHTYATSIGSGGYLFVQD
jgi:hypothetical protein